MEPLMSFEGYQVVENTTKSNDLLNNFYEQMGYVVSDPLKPQSKNAESEKEISDKN